MKYRKKPVVIEAIQWTGKFDRNMSLFVGDKATIKGLKEPFEMIIQTLEGDMTASVGDYIIKGVNGEFYLCKPDVFEKTYEAVVDCLN